MLQVRLVEVRIVVALPQGCVLLQPIQQTADDADLLQLAERLQVRLTEVLEVLLDQIAAKAVEGKYPDPVRLRADELQQPLAHRLHARFREGEAEDVVCAGIRLAQDVTDAGGEEVGFARSRPGQDHHRPVDFFYGGALRRVEAV